MHESAGRHRTNRWTGARTARFSTSLVRPRWPLIAAPGQLNRSTAIWLQTMDKPTLLTAVSSLLNNTHARGSNYAYEQAVRQFNSLLERAKFLYPTRPDIQCMI